MRFIAIVLKSDLSIKGFRAVESLDDVTPVVGEWADLDQYAHVVVGESQNRDHLSAALVNGEIVLQDDAAKVSTHLDGLFSILRQQRNEKLSESDWTQMNDSPLSSELKALWAQYRQELRDLPQNTVDPLNPTWPESP